MLTSDKTDKSLSVILSLSLTSDPSLLERTCFINTTDVDLRVFGPNFLIIDVYIPFYHFCSLLFPPNHGPDVNQWTEQMTN